MTCSPHHKLYFIGNFTPIPEVPPASIETLEGDRAARQYEFRVPVPCVLKAKTGVGTCVYVLLLC